MKNEETIKTYTEITPLEALKLLVGNDGGLVEGLAYRDNCQEDWRVGQILAGVMATKSSNFWVKNGHEAEGIKHCATVTELDPCLSPEGCPELGSMNWVEFDLDGRTIHVSDGGYICYKHKRFNDYRVIAGATQGAGYKVWESSSKQYQVHRIIAEAFLSDFSHDLQVDHINGDRGDNSTGNLRMVTPSENSRGFNEKRKDATSKYRGVCLVEGGRWAANIGYDGKCFALGRFDTEEKAAKAYDISALHNGFSMEALNFPEEHCRIRNYQEAPDPFEEFAAKNCLPFSFIIASGGDGRSLMREAYELGQANPNQPTK